MVKRRGLSKARPSKFHQVTNRIRREADSFETPFDRTAHYGRVREITNVCSREAATGALAPGEAKRNPGSPPKYHEKPRTGRRNNRSMQLRRNLNLSPFPTADG